ncbi:hypothetical protein K3495_g4290 [Podosphaera aphanis]|nr:hypothetical protein K3495_g4290 [Podosphaera aphanis]
MDFWSRLIARASFAPVNKASSNNPEKRLARFKTEYNQILLSANISPPQITRNNEEAEKLRSGLQELTTILSDETRRPLPHPCINFAASKKIYTHISKIASQLQHEGIIREGVAIFAALIESEEEDFVKNKVFSKSLMDLLVEITGANSIRLGMDTEVEVVELSFNITTKIRLDPEILPVWFTAQPPIESPTKEFDLLEAFAGKTQKEDFPLFYLLIDYIHHEGRIGDFARTGLLYIIEATSNSVALEQWIVESDLATLMATGLGALYSQLSRKLVVEHPDERLPPILALSDYQKPHTNSEIVSSLSPDFQMHMETFLSHLVFWQDVLNHCKSTEVKQTLLEHFQVIFLQQLLYPSLLESSDLDGGSSVAVLTYLRRILEALDHPDMIHLILHYLLALPDTIPCPSNSRAAISAARKRKSMDLASMVATMNESDSTPALFNLVDLIQNCLSSPNKETTSVTLQLVSVILRRHHRYAVTTLLRTSQILSDEPPRKIGAHDAVMQFLLGLAEEIGFDQNHEKIYDNYLKDCMNTLESHPCSISITSSSLSGGTSKISVSNATIPGAPRDVRLHTLRPDDHMLEIMLEILGKFLTNSVEVNLALTAVIIDLASCGYMRIDGWLLPDPLKYVFEEDNDSISEGQFKPGPSDDIFEIEEKIQCHSMRMARRTPIWEKSQVPAFLHQLEGITEQIALCKVEISRFEDLLQQRREAFQVASAFPKPTPLRKTQPGASPSLNAFDTLAQRIFPEFVTPAKSKSSRGRKNPDRNNSPGNGLRPEISGSLPPFSISSECSSIVDDSEDMLRQNSMPEVQIANFAGADQLIMTRKVSLPLENRSLNLSNSQEKNEVECMHDDNCMSKNYKLHEDEKEKRTVSVNHILTNVLIFQEFLLELAALVQVRAALFREVSYT